MRRRGMLLLVCAALLAAWEWRADAGEEGIVLRSESCCALFDSAGTLTSVGRTPEEAQARLVSLKIYDRTQKAAVNDAAAEGAVSEFSDKSLVVKKESKALGIRYAIAYAVNDALASTVTLENLTDTLRCMEIEYRFALKDAGYVPFFPGRDDFPDWPEGRGGLVHDYIAGWQGTPLTLPLGTLFAREADAGMSFVAAFDVPIVPFVVRMERRGDGIEVVVSRTRVRLDPHASRSVTTHFVPHAGGWRCGLAFVRSKWPQFFTVTEGADRFQGYWHDIHFPTATREWFGNYYSDKERWLTTFGGKWWHIHQHPEVYPETFLEGKPDKDADWREVVAWLESREVDEKLAQELRKKGAPGNVPIWTFFTREEMRRRFAQDRERGIPAMVYWNPSEVWERWAGDVFKGYEVPGWRNFWDLALCNVHPGSPVEQIYWEKAKAIIDDYRDLTGLHVDQAYYGWTDRRRDDGFSIDEKGPFSDLQRNIGRFVKRVTDYAHAHGMYTDQNHPYAPIELTGWCDLALVEGVWRIGQDMEPGRYITIGNRNCINLWFDQDLMQLNFRNGWFTNRAWNPEQDLRDLPKRSSHNWRLLLNSRLFEVYRGREWVLEPRCLELPEGYDGNMFRRPDGNTVATVVTYGDTPWSAHWRVNVPVTMRIREASAVKAAYFVSGDMLGPRKIDFEREGDVIRVVLPRHRSASAVVLGLSGRFVSIGSPPAVKAGATERMSLVADNFTDAPWEWQAKIAGASPEELTADVPAGGTRDAAFAIAAPESSPHGFFTFAVSMNSMGVIPSPDPPPLPQDTFTVDFPLEGALAAWIAPGRPLVERTISNSRQHGMRPFWRALPEYILEGEEALVELGLSNNTDSDAQVVLAFESKGVRVLEAPGELVLSPREQKRMDLTITGTERGRGKLAVTVTPQGATGTASAEYELDVVGARLTKDDLAQVREVNLMADLWGRTKAGKTKPVSLNGSEVGVLEGGGATDVWITRVRTKLSEDAAKALRVKNAVRMDNPQDDNFKIRRVFLEIILKDGARVLLKAAPACCSALPDWPYAEGRRFSHGKPMVWQLED